jgi:hypothetical protein
VADEVVEPAVEVVVPAVEVVVPAVEEIVPGVEEPAEAVTAQALALVALLPVVGGNPVVALPPADAVPGAVRPAVEPLPPVVLTAETVVGQDDPATARSGSLGNEPTEGRARSGPQAVRAQPAEVGSPEPPTGPSPWGLHESSPMPPAPPTSGAGGPAGDSGVLGPYVVLPSTTPSGARTADWRTPRALSAAPGTRPD